MDYTMKKKENTTDALEFLEELNGPLTIGRLIFSCRKASELSQEELAIKIGTTRAKICDYEKERRIPNLSTVSEIALALGESQKFFVQTALEDLLRKENLDTLRVTVNPISV